MGSDPDPPPTQDPAPPPVRATGADAAQEAIEAKRREMKRYSYEKTILQPGSLASNLSVTPPGTRTTL